ncbi:MAG TPA: hypothetical protein VG603_10170, partial [Chitinophagales bacterium]|nr:hypothetical protein [Chitinophagales bacterium]
MNLKTVILCGGQGLRMRGFENAPHKALMPVNKDTLLSLIINHSLRYNINNFVLALGFNGDA